MVEIKGGVTAAKGFVANGLHCGIRKNRSKPDLALIYSQKSCAAAAVYTKNLVKGAPIYVTMENLAGGAARATVCNSGNANTCNADGIEKAHLMCDYAAQVLGISPDEVIVASTGVIGQPLDLNPVKAKIGELAASLTDNESGSDGAARAIMTTDTVKKELAVSFELGGKTAVIGGIAKGSGMIEPNMATMLSFLTTDAAITPDMLKKALTAAVDRSFNRVSVDGDTSTNDMVSVMASGLAGNEEISGPGVAYDAFADALTMVCSGLAKMVAKDGEGATKLLECIVRGARTEADAAKLAKSVIRSSLVKAAFFGADANWGRILCALGYAGVPADIEKIDVAFASAAGSIAVCENGAGLPFDEDEAKKILLLNEITIDINMKDGASCATAWGCDLTYDYVKINGDYRT